MKVSVDLCGTAHENDAIKGAHFPNLAHNTFIWQAGKQDKVGKIIFQVCLIHQLGHLNYSGSFFPFSFNSFHSFSVINYFQFIEAISLSDRRDINSLTIFVSSLVRKERERGIVFVVFKFVVKIDKV